MTLTTERLYELLPAIQRLRDAERGESLKALVTVLAQQGHLFEQDLERLYDNLFIETCDEWVVPYLGDLLGARGTNNTGVSGFSQRARVANTLAYRRRKGTATMLEQLALDTTGWRARAVEFFELLSATQWLNHLRPHSLRTPDLRNGDALELIDSAFDSAAHSVDVRRIASGRGRCNLPNIGIFLWRLQSYFLDGIAARPAEDGTAPDSLGRFFIHPLGIDAPLFNRPATETEISTLATERNVPGELRRRPLDAEVDKRRLALVNGHAAPENWFGREPAFVVAYRLKAADPLTTVKPEELLIANLEAPNPAVPEVWLRPPDKLSYVPQQGGAAVNVPIQVAVDPVLGRLAFPTGVVPVEVRVSAAHGFPGDLGGGAYDRRESAQTFPLAQVTWQAAVGRELTPNLAKGLFNSFADAVAAWNGADAGLTGVIALIDNGGYAHSSLTIELKAGSRLLIISADWPEVEDPASGQKLRRLGEVSPTERRAHLIGPITVKSKADSQLSFDGLWLEGNLTLSNPGGAGLLSLRLAHTTIVPGQGGLSVGNKYEHLTVELFRSICGPIEIKGSSPSLQITESVVDAAEGSAIVAEETAADIQASTILGTTAVQQLEAGNSIFKDQVEVQRRQTGCVRFSFVPNGSTTPRRYRCQPDLAVEAATSPKLEVEALDRMVPDFTNEHFPEPAYLQLARSCPLEIRTGADDGAEMGVWRFLRQPQREANLRDGLDEYLRLGLEAGLIFVT